MISKFTDEQRKFAEENHNLIYSFMKYKNLDFEEWYSVCAEGFCAAVLSYKDSSGKFGSYAYSCMYNNLAKVLRRETIVNRYCPEDVKLNSVICDNGKAITFEETLKDNEDVMSYHELCDLCESIKSKFSNRDQRIIDMILFDGKTQQATADVFGVSKERVRQIITSFRRDAKAVLCS